jgi:hypothetical protein
MDAAWEEFICRRLSVHFSGIQCHFECASGGE